MYRRDGRMRLKSSARSDRGRVRQNNEDSVEIWAEASSVLAVVADGMGGAVAGEEASRIAVETIRKRLQTEDHRSPEDYDHYEGGELGDLLRSAVQQANRNIINRALSDPELKGMGTTVTLAFVRAYDVTLAHVGDSRCYYVDNVEQSIRQLTADHSFVQALVDAGHITQLEASEHPMKNVLYRALGQTEDLDVDIQPGIRLHAGDRLVLCSDGLTLHVTSDEIAEKALASDDPHVISDNLIELANARGGKDNISVIVIVAEEVYSLSEEDETLSELELNLGADDEKTIPMNPDYLKAIRHKRAADQEDNQDDPYATIEVPSLGTYGEGNDSSDPQG